MIQRHEEKSTYINSSLIVALISIKSKVGCGIVREEKKNVNKNERINYRNEKNERIQNLFQGSKMENGIHFNKPVESKMILQHLNSSS